MTVIHVGSKNQVTLPKEVVEGSHLVPGDPLVVTVEEGRIILNPQVHVPRDQAYFWTPEWQAGEREAEEDIARGRLLGPFDSVAELKKSLKKP